MKVLIVAKEARWRKFMPDLPICKEVELCFAENGTDNDTLVHKMQDADVLAVDAITKVDRDLISRMPNLKMIQSEGVAYNSIDIKAAREYQIDVCNNQGMNAGAVAEQTILLMLGLLRNILQGDAEVRKGNQIRIKEKMMLSGITELADCHVGLYGFGDIAKATAKLLNAFGCKVSYYCRHPLAPEENRKYQVSYLPAEELIRQCDIVSLHVPVTPETVGLVNSDFLSKMKPNALLINTGRGDLVDNEALVYALENHWIAGAGLDTVAPEPVPSGHPLLQMNEEGMTNILFSPHIAGVTSSTFYRGHRMIWENITKVAEGKAPDRIVN